MYTEELRQLQKRDSYFFLRSQVNHIFGFDFAENNTTRDCGTESGS